MSNKKFLGYKLINPEYADAVLSIEGNLTIGRAIKRDQLVSSPEAINKLKKAGVLTLWFKSVYEESSINIGVGDYIVFLKPFDDKQVGEIRRVKSVVPDSKELSGLGQAPSKGWLMFNDGGFRWQGNGYYLGKDFRLATSNEIESYSALPEINGHKGYLKEDLLIYGCAVLPVEWFEKHNGTRSISSMVLSSGVKIDTDQIAQIKNHLDSKYLK